MSRANLWLYNSGLRSRSSLRINGTNLSRPLCRIVLDVVESIPPEIVSLKLPLSDVWPRVVPLQGFDILQDRSKFFSSLSTLTAKSRAYAEEDSEGSATFFLPLARAPDRFASDCVVATACYFINDVFKSQRWSLEHSIFSCKNVCGVYTRYRQ